jgi:hypothetical protein
MTDKITVYTYPDGPAQRLGSYDMVNRVLPNGAIQAMQYGEGLVNGDRYVMPYGKPLPSRNSDDMFHFIATRKMRFQWIDPLVSGDKGSLGKATLVLWVHLNEVHKVIFDPSIEKRSDVLREAVEYVMDQEEL